MNNAQPASHQTIVVIHIGLALGVIFFAGLMYFQKEPGSLTQFEIMTIAGFAAAGGSVVMRGIMAPMIANGQVARVARRDTGDIDEDRHGLLGAYQTSAIVAAALLEGAAFVNVIAYLLEGNPISLGIGGALAVAILLSIPSSSSLEGWIDDKLRDIQNQRAGL